MNLLQTMPVAFVVVSMLLSLGSIGAALWLAPWKALASIQQRQHLWFGTVLGLSLFWLMHVKVDGLMALHPLAMATVAVVFGWSLAILAGALPLLIWLVLDTLVAIPVISHWSHFFTDHLLSVVVPVSTSCLMAYGIGRLRYKNIFFFTLGVGFFGSILGILVLLLVSSLLFFLFASADQWQSFQENRALFVFLAFEEGVINGMMITMFTVIAPDLVKTFDDRAYLDHRQ
ncbi:hypothetical protein MIB92_07965 [Aestuariirhabdus sp. Z084]|uniref:hypothetical protein n=1 Tax=Aestuariirhabdus haliotis TaxID=2918751 RepID=UPI00201B38AD|nr:hypothetical protein [Aestuariirhabdus haliotis]MCL6415582.1 hypothetical protein [Aestuariirhabdus haliotis]MCL6419577.1 hypothetical protein [Aestuariirhabdus haliotis]